MLTCQSEEGLREDDEEGVESKTKQRGTEAEEAVSQTGAGLQQEPLPLEM